MTTAAGVLFIIRFYGIISQNHLGGLLMGTMICLGVGKMEIDWGKNNVFSDHSILFKPEDIKLVPYFYVNDIDSENPEECIAIEYKEGLSRSLSSVKRRLDLLGYTLANVESMYNSLVKEAEFYNMEINLPYETFAALLRDIDITRISTPDYAFKYDENGYDFGEFVRRCIFPEKEVYSRLLCAAGEKQNELDCNLECFFENMDPYIILRLLAENPNSSDLDVYWAYADLVEAGWVAKEEIVKPLPESKRILIVTEGSTDSNILQKAIADLFPDISDFFYFIDMTENYPFTGTGNLYNFCCGLSKIGVLNNVIVIFDNDCSGIEKYEKLMATQRQSNLLIVKLPDSAEFENIETVGPQGISHEDINGRAVSIECFLDFASVDFSPVIRWTSYLEKLKRYQGVLQRKDDYTRAFLKADLESGDYDTTKIKVLINYIIDQWCNRLQ